VSWFVVCQIQSFQQFPRDLFFFLINNQATLYRSTVSILSIPVCHLELKYCSVALYCIVLYCIVVYSVTDSTRHRCLFTARSSWCGSDIPANDVTSREKLAVGGHTRLQNWYMPPVDELHQAAGCCCWQQPIGFILLCSRPMGGALSVSARLSVCPPVCPERTSKSIMESRKSWKSTEVFPVIVYTAVQF